ncbi:MAG: DrmB family protein [Candidatus Rokuibacteriota bacterium]
MTIHRPRYRVGELRPSQILLTFGVGSVVDLPSLSVMVMGLNDWDPAYCVEINEPRLLAAVQKQVGEQVQRLLSPPLPPDSPFQAGPFDESVLIGVPVASFPRWVVCPACRLLAPLASGLFALKAEPYRPDKTRYVHQNCARSLTRPPTVNPARFLVACDKGHLDEFPWVWFVHRGQGGCQGPLRFAELGVSGEAADIQVSCDGCQSQRRMVEAFASDGRQNLPGCHGRRPHLRDYEEGCTEPMTAILLGASNSWFPIVLSALSVPTVSGKLDQLVESHWATLDKATSKDILAAFRQIGQLAAFTKYTDDELWAAIEGRRHQQGGGAAAGDLKLPEWELLSQPDPERNTHDFLVKPGAPPSQYEARLARVVLVERLREVRALIGFTRIESPGDFGDEAWVAPDRRAPLSRTPPPWLPASEVRGEGIFLQLNEAAVHAWVADARRRAHEAEFFEAHRSWRRVRGREPLDAGFPGLRYVLLHSLAHVLMRQLAIECGYAAASIRERIYSADATQTGGPMAGVLIYTAAADSEGTLGGLVSLGQPKTLGRLLDPALEQARLCASDPLCAEHHPWRDGQSLHAAACHACMFAPETSCERGNRYLDRAVLIETVEARGLAFLARPEGA